MGAMMLDEEIREECENLADKVAEAYNLNDDERYHIYDLLIKVCEGEIT